jgi:hypothetical protein
VVHYVQVERYQQFPNHYLQIVFFALVANLL